VLFFLGSHLTLLVHVERQLKDNIFCISKQFAGYNNKQWGSCKPTMQLDVLEPTLCAHKVYIGGYELALGSFYVVPSCNMNQH